MSFLLSCTREGLHLVHAGQQTLHFCDPLVLLSNLGLCSSEFSLCLFQSQNVVIKLGLCQCKCSEYKSDCYLKRVHSDSSLLSVYLFLFYFILFFPKDFEFHVKLCQLLFSSRVICRINSANL